jgi:response regulator of citrate/malate metabolism
MVEDKEIKKKTLLIIDDEEDIRSLSRHIVERAFEFLDVFDASSLNDARQLIKDVIPDFVLLDLHLSDGFGFDIIPELLGVNPKAKILVVTAYNQSQEQSNTLRLGAFGLLGKPFAANDLVDRIKEMMK